MNLPQLSIKRPVTITMIYLGVVILGFISWSRIPQELFPAITYPQITVVTTYENAAPKEVETLITKILEESVATVSQLKRVSSVSKEGISSIFLEFDWGADMDFAALRVREKIDLVKARLPLGATDPIVMKYNPFELPVMILSLTGDIFPLELREFAKKHIKDELEKREGIAKASISGGRKREIIVELDQDKLSAADIPLLRVVKAVENSNFTFPAGTVKERFYEYLIRTMGEYELVDQINDTVVKSVDINEPQTRYEMFLYQTGKQKKPEKRLIKIEDIGSVEDALKEQTSISRYNGRDNVSIAIQKQAGANTLKVAEGVRDAMEKIRERLPKTVGLEVIYDQSEFIENSIKGVRDAAIGGGILAFFILLIFLRSIKSSVIVTCAIPVSIMVAFSLMYFRDITVNMMSLGGLALGVGMLVDNAIVVIENIYRHMHMGKPLRKSVSEGTNEVSGAITSSTLTTIAVFLPLIFVVGIAGQLFKELAFTVTFALIASLLVALTLIPRLAIIGENKIKRKERKTKAHHGFRRVSDLYKGFLNFFLDNKTLGIVIVLIIFIISVSMFRNIEQELLPKVDQREFIINMTMPTGTKLEVTSKKCRQIENILLGLVNVKGVSVSIGSEKDKESGQAVETLGSHEARVVVRLKEKDEIGKEYLPSREVVKRLKNKLETIDMSGAQVEYIMQESVFKAAFKQDKPINVLVRGEDLDELTLLAEDVKEQIEKIEGISDVEDTLIDPQPEIKAEVKRDKVAFYNMSVNDVAMAAQVALKGNIASTFKEKGEEFDIRVRLRPQDRDDLSKIGNILLYSPLDITVPFKEVAYLVRGTGPSEIERRGQQRVVSISANIFGRAFSEVAADVESIIQNIKKPEGYIIELSGEQEEKQRSFKSLQFALLLAITLVYMIMAAQFESLWQPFVIMFTVPLSVIGVVWALIITGTSLNVVAILGFIMLGGIVVNNGIVLIDNINGLRREGMEVKSAVIEGGRNRMRPIMMTALTTILGLLPLALGFGQGAELRSPMAITVIGGLVSSTFLTLIVIPIIYLAVAGMIEKLSTVSVEPVPRIKESLRKELAKLHRQRKRREYKPGLREKKIQEEEVVLDIPDDLNQRQKDIIKFLVNNNKITRKEYSDKFNISISTAARDLKELLERELLQVRGPAGPGRWYELARIDTNHTRMDTNKDTNGHR